MHVSPHGDASFYVAEVGRDYFVVKARAGDPDVAFAWRLSATRKEYAGVRLEEAGLDHEVSDVAELIDHLVGRHRVEQR